MHDKSGESDGSPNAVGHVSAAVQKPVAVALRPDFHRTADFKCSKSSRVGAFFTNECPRYLRHNWCRVFVFEDQQDQARILGFYTISPSLIDRSATIRSHSDKLKGMALVPMALIGFMGRDDGTGKEDGIGAALIIDAARRLHASADFAAWGLMLDAEGGPTNAKLWKWYQDIGFTPAASAIHPGVMYGPLKKFIPELKGT